MKRSVVKLEKLIKKITDFNDARGWNPVPSDSAKSIVIEAAELLEKFQWDESDKYIDNLNPKKNWSEVGQEVADVFWYLVTFCKEANISLSEVIDEKIKWNEKKYPAEKFKGKHNDKFYRAQKKKYRAKRK